LSFPGVFSFASGLSRRRPIYEKRPPDESPDSLGGSKSTLIAASQNPAANWRLTTLRYGVAGFVSSGFVPLSGGAGVLAGGFGLSSPQPTVVTRNAAPTINVQAKATIRFNMGITS
jgi:hypothetical protein